jgi:predicted RNA-binding protein YlxR (DUF448 family)
MIMTNEDFLKFETSDFYLSAFLLAKGFKLIEINKENPHRALFVFKDREDRQRLVEDFLFGRTMINPKNFAAAIKELKQLLYSEL